MARWARRPGAIPASRSRWRATGGAFSILALLVGAIGLACTATRSLAQSSAPPPVAIASECTAEVREAARVRFAATTEPLAELSRTLRVAPGAQPDVHEFVQEIRRQIDENARQVRMLVDELARVAALGCPEWTIAAHARQGDAYELLARAIRDATLTPLPAHLQPRIHGTSQATPGPVLRFADQVRQVLEAQVRPIECFSIISYLRAAREASAQGIDDPHARRALARLLAYEELRIGQCVAHDPSSERYTPGELGTLRGQWQPMTPGLVPPPLAP